jgi:hypothetical protein
MQPTFEHAWLSRFAILAVASATALSVGACSSKHDEKTPAESTSASAPAGSKGKTPGSAQGTVESVSGNAVEVTWNSGKSTLDVDPSKTKIDEYVKAQLTDLANGNCVIVLSTPAPPPGGAPIAALVQVTPVQVDGKCQQPKSAPTRAIGSIAAIEGNTIKVAVTDANGNPAQDEVSVNDKTQYLKNVPSNQQAIAKGKCINAIGTLDDGGTLKAIYISLAAAGAKGECPQPPPQQPAH